MKIRYSRFLIVLLLLSLGGFSACKEEKGPVSLLCGNGAVDPGEECDDGNRNDGDTCSADCTLPNGGGACGNEIVEVGEECDNDSFACRDCQALCGGGDPDECGAHLWSKVFGGDGDEYPLSMAVANDGSVIIAGQFDSANLTLGGGVLSPKGGYDIFLAKYDADGGHVWSKSFGGADNEYLSSIVVDADGSVIIAGQFDSTSLNLGGAPLSNAGRFDIFLAKYAADGGYVWSKSFGGGGNEYPISAAVGSDGSVIIAGEFDSTNLDLDGDSLSNEGGTDIFLAKYDADGGHLWSKSFGGTGNDYPVSAAVGSDGSVIIAGFFDSTDLKLDPDGDPFPNTGSNGIFLAKYNSDGGHLWNRAFKGAWDFEGAYCDVAVDAAGSVIIVGNFNSTNLDLGGGVLSPKGGIDIFSAKYDADGDHLWSRAFGGPSGDDGAYAVALDGNGSIFMSGYFNSNAIDLGGGEIDAPAGGYNIFLAKYKE